MDARIMGSLMVFTFILALFAFPAVSAQYTESLSLTVYPDGYVLVNETVLTANYTVVIDVPLLGSNVDGFIALDENGNVLPADVNETDALVYFENSSVVYISYYTPDLTSKDGPVWTVSLQSPVEVSITLPENAIITDLSDIPLEIKGNTIVMPPGNVSVSYIIPVQTTTTTSSSVGESSTGTSSSSTSSTSSTTSTVPSSGGSSSSTSSSPFTSVSSTTSSTTTSSSPAGVTTTTPVGSGGSSAEKLIGALVVVLIIIGGAYLYLRRRSGSEKTESGASPDALQRFRKKIESIPDLNDDERGALIYLVENGGKAPQSKVRDALGLPKTTAWRMFKRLEERGLVRIYKLGRENWVELVLD